MDIKFNGGRASQDASSSSTSSLNSPKGKLSRFRGAKLSRKSLLIGLAAILLIGALGFAGYSYYSMEQLKKDPQAAAKQEIQGVTAKVGKLMHLPGDEEPTLATVQDKEKLKDQPFFKDAANGDKILIYTKARQAIIYNEKDNRIINVGPITGTEAATQQ